MTRTISFLKREPVLSRIPVATPGEKLHVRHDASLDGADVGQARRRGRAADGHPGSAGTAGKSQGTGHNCDPILT
jgi:hypothetical protein